VRIDIGDGIRLFVDVNGFGLVPDGPKMVERPTIVFLHGGPGLDHSVFKSASAVDYTDIAQVVVYDHRGNGRSDDGSIEDWNLDVWADDVVRLCDALGIEKPIVIGESFGGFVAQRYLARHPEHPRGVVLCCTAARHDVDVVVDAFERVGGPEVAAHARAFWTKGPEAILDYLEFCMPLYSVEEPDDEALGRTVMKLEVMEHFQAAKAAGMDLAPGLAAATCPVLVASGELDPVCPPELGEEIVAALTNAEVTFERIAGASHDDVAPRAEAAIRAFIIAAV
jgi:proline iminopeptidase